MKMYVTGWNRLAGTSKKTGNDYDFYQVDGLIKRFEGEGCKFQASTASVDSVVWCEVLDKAPAAPFLCSIEYNNRGRVVDITLIKCDDIAKQLSAGLTS